MTMLVCVETARGADACGAVSVVAGHAPLAQGGLHGAGYKYKIGRHVGEHCVGNHSKKKSVAPANKPTNRFPRLIKGKHVLWPSRTSEP